MEDVLCPLQPTDFEEMRQQIDPLQDTDDYGISIYLQACSFVSSRVQLIESPE